jgi:hypothetical protein
MKFSRLVCGYLLFWAGPLLGQLGKEIKNYLAVQNITVQNIRYQLVWSAHPDASLYKHEFLMPGDQFPNYKSLVTVDFVQTGSSVDQAVSTKISQLEAMKKPNFAVNYEVIANKATGEKIVDCLLVQTAADDRNSVLERDVYRYQRTKLPSGQEGILLLAVSTRKYGNNITPYLVKLKTEKPLLLNEVAKLPMPAVRIMK